MTEGESVRFSSVVYALPARSATGAFTVTVQFASDAASGMTSADYSASVTLQGSAAALATTAVRGVVTKGLTSLNVSLNNTAAIAASSLWLNVLVLPTV